MTDRSTRKRNARRRTLPGFPKELKFSKQKELREYFSGDKIVCLLCGRELKRLGNHLVPIHGVTEDEYRERYGIPWTYGLNSKLTTGNYSLAVKKRIEYDGFIPEPAKGESLYGVPRRKSPPVRRDIRRQNLKKTANPPVYNQATWDEFAARVEAGEHPLDIAASRGMPSKTRYYEHTAEDEKFAGRAAKAKRELSFSVLARHEELGTVFAERVKTLRSGGMFFYRIAEQLGVSTMTVVRHCKKGIT